MHYVGNLKKFELSVYPCNCKTANVDSNDTHRRHRLNNCTALLRGLGITDLHSSKRVEEMSSLWPATGQLIFVCSRPDKSNDVLGVEYAGVLYIRYSPASLLTTFKLALSNYKSE